VIGSSKNPGILGTSAGIGGGGGEVQETSKKNVLKAIAAQDLLQEEETPQGFFEDAGLG